MAQLSWQYADPFGHQYNIGVYHGSDSGHVLIHCNEELLLVDFSIVDDKQYSFYIGEEFFELDLRKRSEAFTYELKINKEISTPLNNIRNKVENEYATISIVLAIMFVGGIALATYLLV